ncbi:myosin-3-like [Phragmites australis]|uniref:myosin-3-like n=1 Tax=Phragmites australis TaxID=29695 RepID=UPI002D77449A|nr:myosin-3-like [Phragmites australis]
MASSLSSALSSMEVMLDALMQRGIGKPEDQKPKEEAPPALPTRPTVRGRLPSLHSPGATAPWIHRPPLPPLPPAQKEEEEKCSVNLDLERRALKAEEEVKQRDEEVRKKEDEIAALRQQVEHYESWLSECEVRIKSVEDELKKQITSLQMAQTTGGRRGGSTTTSQHRQESPGDAVPPSQSSTRRQHGCVPTVVIVDKRQTEVNQLAKEFRRDSEAFEHGARVVVVEAAAPPGSAKSVDELKTLKRQFGAWKEYETRLLKKLVHTEKSQSHGHGHQRRCGWWRMKAPKCKAPKCCSFKFPSPKLSCFCCCFRCCC